MFLGFLGCSTTEELYEDITAPDYVNSSKAKRLEVPPDLSQLDSNSSYETPGEAKSYRDYLDREKELSSSSNNYNKVSVVKNPEGMKIIKSGNLRWLLVNENPDLIWPHVKDFWEDLGFRVIIANKKTGIIETEWMDTDDIKLDQREKGALSNFDKWLDSLSGFSDKRKFRTRIEYGDDGNTEIYISQRSAEAAADQHSRILSERDSGYNPSTIYKIEEYKSDDKKNVKKLEISEQREIDDYEIDSELLTRLMIKLGATDLHAQDKIANPEVIIKSTYNETKSDVFITMNDPYERAWRRLGLALDIIGFVTEDKNRSSGIYYVRFSEIDLPQENEVEEEGLIDSLIFWRDSPEREDKSNKDSEIISKPSAEDNEPNYTGIEVPEIEPLDKDYIPEEMSKEFLDKEEETWVTKLWPSWGSEDDKNALPENEKRYRIRIKPIDDGKSIVYLDFPSERKNISNDARKILKLINEYLK
jgi:outer membrane protein assembly factor BamC